MNNIFSKNAILLLACLAVAAVAPIGAESVRGPLAGTLTVGGPAISLVPEELVAVNLGGGGPFLRGVELRIEFPADFRPYRTSFALMIYRDIDPGPTDGTRSYAAVRSYMQLLPNRDSVYLRIPIEEDHGISGDALTTVLPAPVETGSFPLLATIIPVMKGIPDDAFDQPLRASLAPLYEDKGSLDLRFVNLSGDPGEILTLTIDGERKNPEESPFVLDAGLHRVRVESNRAAGAEKTVAVEPGDEIELLWELDYTPPELSVEIPEGIEAFFDGVLLETGGSSVVLNPEPGPHTITFRAGDFTVTRDFTLLPGGKVAIGLRIDIDLRDYGEQGSR
jgi:hypothetical protein